MYTHHAHAFEDNRWHIHDPDGDWICTILGTEDEALALLSHLNRG